MLPTPVKPRHGARNTRRGLTRGDRKNICGVQQHLVVIRSGFRSVASSTQSSRPPTPNDGDVHIMGHSMQRLGNGNVAVEIPRISYDADDAAIYPTKWDNTTAVVMGVALV
jgi:hypothetical protein